MVIATDAAAGAWRPWLTLSLTLVPWVAMGSAFLLNPG